MIELIQILAVVFSGLFAAEAMLCSHETRNERRGRQRVQRVVHDKYPPTY
jgi:hypothetical protein